MSGPIPTDNSLAGRVAIVTGSTQGIGAGIARKFAAHGARVVVHGLDAEGGKKTAERIHSAGGEAHVIIADLRNEDGCRGLVEQTVEHWGRLDVLVNNAAVYPRGDIESTSVSLWDEIFSVNLRAPFILCQESVKHMKASGGSILNIGSVNAHFGKRNLLAYSAAKGGLTIFTRNLANDLVRHHIRVNQINPGWVLTEGEHRIQSAERRGTQWLDEAVKTRPFGRLLTPDDIARMALLFVADGMITGAVVDYEQVPVGAPPEF
jgi:NAD(P)-dependent dehydrogenase (short-subunit alcohol dehydrogenase family)